MILLVENDPDEADLFLMAAAEAGINKPIQVARNGEQALDMLINRSLHPEVTLLDLKMPGIGGLETLRRIRSQPALKDLLVFVVTSSDLEQDKADVRRLGCDVYFIKPITFSSYVEMAARIKSLLPQEE